MKILYYLKSHKISRYIVEHKYSILLISSFIYIAFFDKYNLINQWRLSQTINEMETEMEYYKNEIKETKAYRDHINDDLEEFAREEYYMHKKNEDIYIFNIESDK